LFITLSLATSTALGQAGDVAKQVYRSSQGSVFLVYVNDSSGTPSALGSAFLVAPRILVTNAHVVEAGTPVLAVGSLRFPLKILRIDQKDDLAILGADRDLTSKPLPLAPGTVSPGEQIFAIGNPEGLEKTISQGIVSGLRKREDRDLLQITSPISHGSSGGPILNARGEVVGVTVGALDDGQNLNFAVPVSYVKSLLEQNREAVAASSRTIAELKQLATRGDIRAMFFLGLHYERGEGVAQDFTQAAFWYRKAAVGGEADAQFKLGWLYESGNGMTQDYAQAATWFSKAADQGMVDAQFSLGVFYEYGKGVPQDYTQAAVYYRKAADQGDADAQRSLGDAYAKGEGVARDIAQALAWYLRAADQGNTNAQVELGKLYYYGGLWELNDTNAQSLTDLHMTFTDGGGGFAKNYSLAALWFRKAAEQGNEDAQDWLAGLYDDGNGVPQSYVEAYFWHYLAGMNEPMYLRNGAFTASILTKQQLLHTQERARKWLEDHPTK
jgi:TPR repeat protein